MQSKIPVYPYNAKTAQERGELDKWRESFRENCACAGGIDILIRENFDGMHLKAGTVEKIVELYGYKRVEHVLANTVQERRGDGRFRPDNRAWAESHFIPPDEIHEQWELCQALGGCFADIIEGTYKINLLEPRCWDTDADPYDVDAPKAFRQSTRLAQHTSFLKDVFRTYKDFTTAQIDTIEIMLTKLYTEWGITEETDFSQMRPEDYPILSELYDFIEIEYENFDETKPQLYTRETLQQILLGLHSMCRGADSKFFNGHTNLTSTRFLVFGVKGLLSVAQNVRSTILLNLLSYMSDKLLTEGNTVAALDELYIWLSNPVAIEYIRNSLKRVRKKESALVLASQNLEDFDQPGVREMTKPLFSIPPHQFLFNAGSIDRRAYMDMLQLEDSEFDLIKFPQRGVCLYKCGNERYLLEVHAPPYKEALFGKAGGR